MLVRGRLQSSAAVRSQRGFSLFELLFVMALIGLLATVMLPSKGPSDSIKLDLAASEIADALRFARSEALRQGVPHGVRFQRDEKRVRVYSMDTGTSPATPVFDIYHPVDRNIYDRQLAAMPFDFSGVMHVAPAGHGSCNNIEDFYFDADGVPWCADPDDVLLYEIKIALRIGNELGAVWLHGITGRVTIE
jgi:prepilin-type N-terminal cleavage/methylation domain-containing protein